MNCALIPLLFFSSLFHLGAQEKEAPHAERFASPTARAERAEAEASARLRENPNNASALADRGEARLRLGKLDEAVQDFRQAAALDPASADSQANLAYGLWRQRRLPEALAAAQAALARNADQFSAHYYLGLMLLQSGGELEQAIQHLQRALQLNPEGTDVRFDLLTAYRRKGDSVRAGLQLRFLRSILPPNDARLPYIEGLFAADHGRLSTAIDRFRQALAAEPGLTSARQDLGLALVQSERWQEAVDVLGPLAKEYPESHTTAYFHALALQNSQRGAEAEQEARRAIRLAPEAADAYTLLGIILSARGAYTDARGTLETAVRLDPKSFDAQLYLGRARYAVRDLTGASEAFQAALALKPEEVEPRFFLATVLEAAGDTAGALEQYRVLTRARPQDARGFVGLGNLLAKQGRLDEAVPVLRQARELDPQNFEAALALGRGLLRTGQVAQAINLLQEAVHLGPDSADAHYQLGLALRRAGRALEAAGQFAIVDRLNEQYRNQSGGMGPPQEQ
ncbi:MAG: tetratricopeptide repeat protein [Acidobacteria bacterium]|nr:tetratricopeptide repeat protein [Acidobacteriota bacterium]